MAGIMTGMRVEGATVIGAQPLPPSPATYREHHRRSRPQQLGAYGLMAAILLALLIGGMALRDRQGTRPVASVTEHINKAERQTQQRFMENNTTNLPNAATAETLPVAASAQQRFGPAEHDQIHSALEMANGATAGGAPSGLSSSQPRFLEVNTVMLPAVSSYPYAEDLTPPLGQRR